MKNCDLALAFLISVACCGGCSTTLRRQQYYDLPGYAIPMELVDIPADDPLGQSIWVVYCDAGERVIRGAMFRVDRFHDDAGQQKNQEQFWDEIRSNVR